MRTVEIARAVDASVLDQLGEMRSWLRQAQIEPLSLEAVRIINGRIYFRASFANPDDAERFRRRFDAVPPP